MDRKIKIILKVQCFFIILFLSFIIFQIISEGFLSSLKFIPAIAIFLSNIIIIKTQKKNLPLEVKKVEGNSWHNNI